MWSAGTAARLDCRPAGVGFGRLSAKGAAGPSHRFPGNAVARGLRPGSSSVPRRGVSNWFRLGLLEVRHVPDIGCLLAVGERRTERSYVRVPVAMVATAALCLALSAAANAAGQATLRATTTTVVASAYHITYDSVVRFSAHVTSAGKTPTGSVSFIDKVNGGILDSVALSNGRAAFSTAALAPGTRSIVPSTTGARRSPGASRRRPASSSAASMTPPRIRSTPVTMAIRERTR